jgi:hypothetical protein
MKVQIKNPKYSPNKILSLFDYFKRLNGIQLWEYMGLTVELDPTFDFKDNDALIRWTDIDEGFNDKIIVNSLEEFNTHFTLINA